METEEALVYRVPPAGPRDCVSHTVPLERPVIETRGCQGQKPTWKPRGSLELGAASLQ